jgi:hypothetical protein
MKKFIASTLTTLLILLVIAVIGSRQAVILSTLIGTQVIKFLLVAFLGVK